VIVQDRHSPPESGTLAKAASGALDVVPYIHVVNIARTRILLVPRKIAPRVVTGTAVEAERLMQRELNAALAEIAATPV